MRDQNSWKEQFPQMPAELKHRIAQVVQEQTGEKTASGSADPALRRRINLKKSLLIVSAATFAAGMTVFAVSRLYIETQQDGKYGLKITVAGESEALSEDITVLDGRTLQTYVPKFGYVPPSMEMEDGKLYGTDGKTEEYISLLPIMMDETAQGDIHALSTFVESSETLSVGEHEALGVYRTDGSSRYYIVYPEERYILEVTIGADTDKEEAKKVMEAIALEPADGETENARVYTWSDYAVPETETEAFPEEADGGSPADLAALYKTGDKVPAGAAASVEENGEWKEVQLSPEELEAAVTKVQIADDLSLLTQTQQIPEIWKSAVGEDGKLKDNVITFVRTGDGINTLDEIVSEKETAQKLVYVTMEYTNRSGRALRDVYYYAGLHYLHEEEGGYTFRLRPEETDGTWDTTEYSGAADDWWEMRYTDVKGGERENNYIPKLADGQSATVHLAWIVNEDNLPFLCLKIAGDSAVKTILPEEGFVDIRQ